jgi:hypothetical protein
MEKLLLWRFIFEVSSEMFHIPWGSSSTSRSGEAAAAAEGNLHANGYESSDALKQMEGGMQSVVRALDQISDHLSSAHLFVDSVIAECLHWGTSTEMLIDTYKIAGISVIENSDEIGARDDQERTTARVSEDSIRYDTFNVLQPQSLRGASSPVKAVFLLSWRLQDQSRLNLDSFLVLEGVTRIVTDVLKSTSGRFSFRNVLVGLAWPKNVFHQCFINDDGSSLKLVADGVNDCISKSNDSVKDNVQVKDSKDSGATSFWMDFHDGLEQKSVSSSGIGVLASSVKIGHIPLFISPILPNVMLLPSCFSSSFAGKNEDVFLSHTSISVSAALESLNLSPEIYSIGGSISDRLGAALLLEDDRLGSLAARPSATFQHLDGSFFVGKKDDRNYASVVMIDRNIDLLPVVGHEDHILDRVFSSCRSVSENRFDIVCEAAQGIPCETCGIADCEFCGIEGSLAHFGDRESMSLLDALTTSTERRGLKIVQKFLQKLPFSSSFSSPNLSPDQASQLESFLKSLSPQDSLSLMSNHQGALEVIVSVLGSLKRSPNWEEVANFEKLMRLSHSNPSHYQIEETSLLSQLTALILSHCPNRVDLMTCLCLTIYCFCLHSMRTKKPDAGLNYTSTSFPEGDVILYVDALIKAFGNQIISEMRNLGYNFSEEELKADISQEFQTRRMVEGFLNRLETYSAKSRGLEELRYVSTISSGILNFV